MDVGPAIHTGVAVLPPSERSPDDFGWGCIIRRLEDQRSALDKLEWELGVAKDSRDLMA
jgi:hypothetical protein